MKVMQFELRRRKSDDLCLVLVVGWRYPGHLSASGLVFQTAEMAQQWVR